MSSNTFEGHVSADTPRGYLTLPFYVPARTTRIDIAYTCTPDLSDRRPDENPLDFVADLAIFDSRGAEFMGAGYRGTSGNSRSTIFIAADDATPGYSPGALPPGEWTVVLGFFRFGPGGCGYQVHVNLTPGDSIPTDLPAFLPLRAWSDRSASATGWYKGELHCHTFHSDGDSSPLAVLSKAEQLGLDFLAVTDHNVFTQQIDLNRAETDLMLIPGCEVTTAQGHWNIWGDSSGGWIEFRGITQQEMEATIADAKRKGYLTSCNHPRPNGPPWRLPDVEGYQCVEVWNGGWENLNDICLEFWEQQIRAGKRLVAVGGSDCHELEESGGHGLAHPTTYIYCGSDTPSPARLLDGLRAGHAFITRSPDGPQLYLTSGSAMMGDTITTPSTSILTVDVHVIDGSDARLELYTAQGIATTRDIEDENVKLSIDVPCEQALYIRVQLRDPRSGYVLALTNPIYLDY